MAPRRRTVVRRYASAQTWTVFCPVRHGAALVSASTNPVRVGLHGLKASAKPLPSAQLPAETVAVSPFTRRITRATPEPESMASKETV